MVTNGKVLSRKVKVKIILKEERENPVALPKTVQVLEDTPTDIILEGILPSGGSLKSAKISSLPSHGTLSSTFVSVDGNGQLIVTYTPSQDFDGDDSFSYQVVDSFGVFSDSAELKISVVAVNDAPQIQAPLTVSMTSNKTLIGGIQIIDTDAGNAELTLTIKSGSPLELLSFSGYDDAQQSLVVSADLATLNDLVSTLFFINPSKEDTTILIGVSDNGASGQGVGSLTTFITINVVFEKLPASAAVFTDSLLGLTVDYLYPVARVLSDSSTDCLEYFAAETAVKFGEESTCTLLPKQLEVFFEPTQQFSLGIC